MNKPLLKRAQLANAQSLKPYFNPNAEYYSHAERPQNLSGLDLVPDAKQAQLLLLTGGRESVQLGQQGNSKSLKLIPVYQSKEYTKMRTLLPTFQSSVQKLQLAGGGSASGAALGAEARKEKIVGGAAGH